MNCPGHMLVYKSGQYSYNDLPLRLHDQGVLHRNETSGAIGGLTRCRSFCLDDGHVFCTLDQAEAEIKDRLEWRACERVCGGTISLGEARAWFKDWRSSYAREFGEEPARSR